MWLEKGIITAVVILLVVIVRVGVHKLFKRRGYTQLTGYKLLINVIVGILFLFSILYLLSIWEILQPLFEFITAAGIIMVIFLFCIKETWLSNAFAGLLLIEDKYIHVGAKVEIRGIKGRIVDITITQTKIETKDGLLLVPNIILKTDAILIRN